MKIERFGKITLINGDCMEYMRECKDKHFDVLVADPPYGDANFQNPPSEEIATGGGRKLSRTGGTWFTKYKLKPQDTQFDGEARTLQQRITPPPQHSDSQSNTGI